jgi:hypothetical protein
MVKRIVLRIAYIYQKYSRHAGQGSSCSMMRKSLWQQRVVRFRTLCLECSQCYSLYRTA